MTTHDAARTLGRRGGRARAARLSANERRRIAAVGGKARSLSRHAADRIADNFRYLAAVDRLRGSAVTIERLNVASGRLPSPTGPRE